MLHSSLFSPALTYSRNGINALRVRCREAGVIRSCEGGSMQHPRREFIEILLGAATANILNGQTRSGDMIYRTLGKTGERVSAIGLGGSHIGRPADEQDGIRIIRT